MTNPSHNFLYIAFNFPPFAGASPRHNLSTIKGLIAAGFVPTVITASEQKPPPLLLDIKLARDDYLRSKIPEDLATIPCDWPLKYHPMLTEVLNKLKIPSVPYTFNWMANRIATVAQRQIDAALG